MAPSTRAASSGSFGIDWRPIVNSSALTPTPCQAVGEDHHDRVERGVDQPARRVADPEHGERLVERAVGWTG